MLSPVYPPTLEADNRGGWNLKEQRAGQQHVDAGAERVQCRNKRDPARSDLGDRRHQKRNDADDEQRHEQAGDQTIAAHLAVIVCVETQSCPKAQDGARRKTRYRVDQRMDEFVDDDEPRNQEQVSGQGHGGRNVAQWREEKPKRCHRPCRDDADRQCEKVFDHGRRRLAQWPPRRVRHEVR